MKNTIALLLSLLAVSAHAGDSVKPTIDVTEIRLVVTWTDAIGVRMARERHNAPIGDLRSRIGSGGTQALHRGFSVLTRNRTSGAYTCRVYAMRPEKIDDDHTTSIGHEIAHCLLGEYHR